jgi:diaminopropionate ammonia-lyase
MRDTINWTANKLARPETDPATTAFLGGADIAAARRFHAAFPEYRPTPLVSLARLAARLGVGGVYIKDESCRFGLNAFKILGGSWAIARHLGRRLGLAPEHTTPDSLAAALRGAAPLTFATATDGNHGRGVAWTARRLGCRAVVYLPEGAARHRIDAIRAEGAQAVVTALNYDAAVRLAAADARRHSWTVIQDTAWEGYRDIPAWIMQGYGTMIAEALDQLAALGVPPPTHVLVQAGVGSLAAAVQGCLASAFPDNRPHTVVVEADKADCLYRSALAGDGRPQSVGGDLATIMAGLACGEPNPLAWDILRRHSQTFVSCPDWVAALGMRLLGAPLPGDPRIISGESGAVTAGLLLALTRDAGLEALRRQLGLGAGSRILLFSTEGDTDPDSYRRIVWDGQYPSPHTRMEVRP